MNFAGPVPHEDDTMSPDIAVVAEPANRRDQDASAEPQHIGRGAAPSILSSATGAGRVQRRPGTTADRSTHRDIGATSSTRAQRSAGASARRDASGPVPGRTIERMERSFGADFGSISFRTERTFDGPLDPLAKVHGNTVSLAPSVAPNSRLGRSVIGHELAHVTQRSPGPRSGELDMRRERDAFHRGSLAARGLAAGPAAVGGSDPNEPEFFPPLVVFLGYVAVDVAIDQAGEAAIARLQSEFEAAVSTKVNEVNAEVRAYLEETSPTGLFLIEHGVAHVRTYQKVKAALEYLGPVADKVADAMMERIIAEQMREGGAGAPSDAELRIFMGLLKEGSVGAVRIADVIARSIFTKIVGEYVETVDGAEEIIATGAQWILDKADLAEKAAVYAETGNAIKSRLSMMKFAYKKMTGKKTLGDKIVEGAGIAREQATKVQETTAKAREKIDQAKELLVDGDDIVTARVTAKSLGNLKQAAASAGIGAVAAAKIAFDRARDDGLSTQEMLDAAHLAGGKEFMIEMLGAALAEGGRMFIFKGIVYLIPGAGAVAEVIADVGSTMFKVVYDVYGDTLRGHTEWALSNVSALLAAGIGTAKAAVESGVETVGSVVQSGVSAASWAAQYLTDVASWSIANPFDALCLGIKNTAVAIGDSPKYATKAVESGTKAVTSGVYGAYKSGGDALTSVQQGVSDGLTSVQEGISSGISSVQDSAVTSVETAKTVAKEAWALKGEVPKIVYDTTKKLVVDQAKQLAVQGAFYGVKLALKGIPGVNYACLVAEAVVKFAVKHPELARFAYDYVAAVCEVTNLSTLARGMLLATFEDEIALSLDDLPEEFSFESSSASSALMIPIERTYWGTAVTGSGLLFGASRFSAFPGCFSPVMGASWAAMSQLGLPKSTTGRVERLIDTAKELDDELGTVMVPSTSSETETPRQVTPLSGLRGAPWSRIHTLVRDLESGTSTIERTLQAMDSVGDPTPRSPVLNHVKLGTIAGLAPMNRALFGLDSVSLTLMSLSNSTVLFPDDRSRIIFE